MPTDGPVARLIGRNRKTSPNIRHARHAERPGHTELYRPLENENPP
jgi:hypothetical protein